MCYCLLRDASPRVADRRYYVVSVGSGVCIAHLASTQGSWFWRDIFYTCTSSIMIKHDDLPCGYLHSRSLRLSRWDLVEPEDRVAHGQQEQWHSLCRAISSTISKQGSMMRSGELLVSSTMGRRTQEE